MIHFKLIYVPMNKVIKSYRIYCTLNRTARSENNGLLTFPCEDLKRGIVADEY